MKIEQGYHRRTSWWRRVVAILAAIAALLGATIHSSANEGSGDPKPTTSPWTAVRDTSADSQLETHALSSNQKYVVGYFVADVLSKIREERGLSQPEAEEFLTGRLKAASGATTPNTEKRENLHRMGWSKDILALVANRAGHKQIAEMLDAFRKFGTAEIAIEVRFFTLREEDHQKVFPNSTTVPLNVGEAALAGSKKDQAAKAEATPVSWKNWLIGHHEQRETQELVLMLRAEKIVTPNHKGIE